MPGVGFEPTHLTIIELKSTALDRSAIQACNENQPSHWWPSGLRRYVQVVVSSDAWVQIPPNALKGYRARVVKGSDSKSDERMLAGVQIPPVSLFVD